MSFICAQIDSAGRVKAVCRLREPVGGEHIIPLAEWRDDILGWTYNREDGQFYPPQPEEQE